MTTGAKVAIGVGIAVILVLVLMNRQPVKVTSTNRDASNVDTLFAFGKIFTDLAGRVVASPQGDDTDGEYTGPGGYDTSSYRVYND